MFLMFVPTFKLQWTRILKKKKKKFKFAVHDSETPLTLKQSQGQQTWYELIDLQAWL